jgi:hypothetical protein
MLDTVDCHVQKWACSQSPDHRDLIGSVMSQGAPERNRALPTIRYALQDGHSAEDDELWTLIYREVMFYAVHHMNDTSHYLAYVKC